MSQKIRRDEILATLEKQGYTTVNELVTQLHYSSATIYRDLNELQNLNLVKRSYGGVELTMRKNVPGFPLRHDYMKLEKRQMGRIAAAMVENGDRICIAGTTTTEYILPYLEGKKDLLIVTNDMRLAESASEYGFETVCLGGRVFERPSILMSEETIENAMKFRFDKFFFSTGAFTSNGKIGAEAYAMLYRVIMENSKKTYFLGDHSKMDADSDYFLCDFSKIDCVISDVPFSDEVKNSFNKTEFIHAKI